MLRAKIVRIVDVAAAPMRLSCGHHTDANGRAAEALLGRPYRGMLWWCERCRLPAERSAAS